MGCENVEVALEEVRHLARGYVDYIFFGTIRDHRGIPGMTSFANTSGTLAQCSSNWGDTT